MISKAEYVGMPFSSRILGHFEDLLHMLACGCLMLLTGLITLDVISRTLFNIALHIQFELTELYLMPALAVLSLARVYRDNAHLSLEVINPERYGRAWPYLHVLILAISSAFFVLLAWRSGIYAYKALSVNSIYFGVYDWPLGIAYASIPIGSGMLCLRLIHDLIIAASFKKPVSANKNNTKESPSSA